MSEPKSDVATVKGQDSTEAPSLDGQISSADQMELIEIKRQVEMILEEVPPESKTPELVVDTALKVVQTHRLYSGPHPSPVMLAELKEVDSTLPDRAMAFAEREQGHRHQRDMNELDCVKRGQWMTFGSKTIGQVLAVVMVGGIVGVAAMLIHYEKNVAPLAPIVYSLAVLAGVIIAAKTVTEIFPRTSAAKDVDEESTE